MITDDTGTLENDAAEFQAASCQCCPYKVYAKEGKKTLLVVSAEMQIRKRNLRPQKGTQHLKTPSLASIIRSQTQFIARHIVVPPQFEQRVPGSTFVCAVYKAVEI